jgi:hypothetical protein
MLCCNAAAVEQRVMKPEHRDFGFRYEAVRLVHCGFPLFTVFALPLPGETPIWTKRHFMSWQTRFKPTGC